ncbi:ABC transporter substrate-binding protein [Betaproteobacteria bacterium]|nr:ABC transporter substrate-binding protein [Betaproteobacteria bacterium]
MEKKMRGLLHGAVLALAMFVTANAFAAETVVKILDHEPTTREERDFLLRVAKNFEAANPTIKVEFDFLDDTSFKAKLPTLLQSPERPDAFFTWTGGVFYEQAETGILRDITDEMDAKTKSRYATIGLDGLSYKGRLYGVPMYATNIPIWYNRELLDKAKVDPASIKTWDDFLAACTKLKNAGITPIVIGGKDKWPIAFFFGPLALRILGMDGINAANRGENGGFDNAEFIKVGREFKRLVDIQPFQPGYMDTGFHKSVGLFGDGIGAFLPIAHYVIDMNAKNSTSGKGIGDKLDFIPFPAVTGGKGDPGDTFGGINGWLITKNAKPETLKFLEFLTNEENQLESGRLNLWLPIVKGTQSGLQDPRVRRVAELLEKAPHHQLYLDQALGAIVGTAVNDVAAELSTGEITPEEAAANVEEARQIR